MNSITAQNTWFAIDIDTGSTETINNMFLVDGHIRFTTDNYDPVVTSATYEDLSPVAGTWYKDSLKMDGLEDTLINIDLSFGTGYSTLNGWSFSIINRCANGSPYHKAILDTTSTYLLGSNITLYVVIDNVFYKRWSGIVSDYAISEDYFKINCDDRFIKNFNLFPKTTIGATNYPKALEDSIGKVIPVAIGDVKYAKPVNIESKELNFKVGTSFPLIRIKPDVGTGVDPITGIPNNPIRGYDYNNNIEDVPEKILADDEISYKTETTEQYFAYSDAAKVSNPNAASHQLSYYSIINPKNVCICITVAKGTDVSKLIGNYVTLSNNAVISKEDKNLEKTMKIVDVTIASTDILTDTKTDLVYLVISDMVNGVSDDGNFYGKITTSTDFLDNLDKMSDESLYVYIWEVSNIYKISEGDVTVVNSVNTNPKVIKENGPVTFYKSINEKIVLFNPYSCKVIDANTINIMAGESAVYHIPKSARFLEYVSNSDPVNIETLGNWGCDPVLNSTITWDDDQLNVGRDNRFTLGIEYPEDMPLFNRNSLMIYRPNNNGNGYDGTSNGDVLNFIMNYNLDTFDPYMYTRVVPSPIWNTHAYAWHWTGSSWVDVNLGNRNSTYYRATVYGITKSHFNGDILTAEMGQITSPINRVRVTGGITIPHNPSDNCLVSMALPNINTNLFDLPSPVEAHAMTGYLPYGEYRYWDDVHNAMDGNVYYGHVTPNREGIYNYYFMESDKPESCCMIKSIPEDISEISNNLWDSFDENGNISISMELTTLYPDKSRVSWDHKTVHCIGLTGYIDYEPKDLYVRVHGECNATVPDAFDLILTTYNGVDYVGRTNLVTYRSGWNVGRQVTEQQNSLQYINELCAQSWVVGWTNRSGNVELRALEDKSVSYTHDDNIILRDSIKNFNLTPLTKVCNELTIEADYNMITGKYDKVYAVDNIDQPSFPLATDGDGIQLQLQNDPTYETYAAIQSYDGDYFLTFGLQNTHYNGIVAIGDYIRVNPFKILVYTDDSKTTLLDEFYYDGNTSTSDQPPFGGVIKGTEGQSLLIVNNIIYDNPTAGWTYLQLKKDEVTGALADVLALYPTEHILMAAYYSEMTKVDTSSINATWRSWVQGIDSYADAKDIWNTCKNAWYENKTINQYPSALSKLSWFNNRNNFEDVTTYDETAESAYMFFKKAITWCTRQKYKLVYQIPLTADTIKVDLMDTILWHDPILTGFTDGDPSYLDGYVTSLSCKPSEKVIEIELTAEMVYVTPAPMPITGDIIELATNTDDIIELSTNTDNIIEG